VWGGESSSSLLVRHAVQFRYASDVKPVAVVEGRVRGETVAIFRSGGRRRLRDVCFSVVCDLGYFLW
jgi:hypothetical protein